MDDVEALRTGLDRATVPALLSDLPTGMAIGANDAAVKLLRADELVGIDVIAFVHPG